MSVRTWFDSLTSRLSRPPARRSRRVPDRRLLARRLLLEGLEDRRVLAFDLAVDYPVGTSPLAVVTADFNGDGRLDIASANAGSNVSVLLGNANGTFQPAQNSATGTSPLSLAMGDFNADGNLDLATANAGDVSVLLGNGTGAFQAPANIDIGSSPASVAVGDFNGDGKMDLAVGGHTSYYIPPWGGCGYYGCYGGGGYWVNQPNVSVLMGSGDGGFAVQSSYDLWEGTSATSVVVADLNGDGKADVVAGAQNPVHVLLGNGDGTLQSPLRFGNYGSSIAIADIDGDGNLDLAMTASGYVGVALGNGLGAFGATQYFAAGANMTSVAVADFNGDGTVDLVASDQGSNTVNVLLGAGTTGTVAFKPPLNVATGAWPFDVVVGDFNGDGLTDAASANYDSGASSVSVLLNDGTWPALDAPSITITDVTVTEENSGTVRADFNVSLSAGYSQTVTVHYATVDGTATAGSDYQAAIGTLTFAPGVTSQSVSVLVNGDRLGESYSESFSVHLSDPTNALVADATGVGIITDDEPYINIIDYLQGTEGNAGTTPMSFTVTLSVPYDVPVTIDYATADLTPDEQYWYGGSSATAGVDYTATFGTLTIPAGQTSGTVTVPVIGDREVEVYELFFVRLSNPTNANLGYSQALAEIVDDEPYVSINSGLSGPEGNSGTTPMTFTVSLSAVYDTDVTVSYATVDGSALAGSDYVAASGTVTIPAGQTSQQLPVQVKGDVLAESDEYFYVQLTGATNAALSNNWGYAYITDDDTPPTIFMGDASIVEGNSGTKLMSFIVTLSKASGTAVQVSFTTADGSAKISNNDYVAKSGTVFFAPGETSKTITVTIKGDTKKEPDERFFVNLSAASGGTIGDSQGVGTIINDDSPGKKNSKGSQLSSASATDAAIDDWMFSTRKKRTR